MPRRSSLVHSPSAIPCCQEACLPYTEVPAGKDIKISTESEFSPNDLVVKVDAGKNYFVRQYIKVGAFVGGAGVEAVSEAVGKNDIAKLEMAKPGNCSGAR